MCNLESTHRSRLPNLVRPQFGLMASSFKDTSSSLWDLGTLFVATIMDAKDFIDQLQATFCEELWPAICGEIENSRRKIAELEKFVDVSNKQHDERQQLKSQREDERTRLRAGNLSLRMELEQLLKKGTRLETDNQILQKKLQSLLEQNLNVEKQLPSTPHQLFRKAEKQKVELTRSQGKSEVLHSRLSLKSQKKLIKVESPSSLTAGKNVDPVSSEQSQNLKESPPIPFAFSLQGRPICEDANQNVDQGVDCPVSDLEMKEQSRERSPLEMEADRAPYGEAFVVSLESPPSAEARGQGEPAKDSREIHAQNIICTQKPKAKCDAESRACPPARFVDSDETVMDVVQVNPSSAGIVQEYPVVSIASETEAEPCDEPLQLPSGRASDFIPRRVVGQKKVQEDTAVVGKAGPLVSISPNLPNFRPPSRAKVENKQVKGPKEQSWRKTRYRAEPSDIDPHDSFLDTPRERVLAQLEEARTAQILSVPHGSRGPVANKLDCGSLEATQGGKGAQRQKDPSATSLLMVEASNAGFSDRKESKASVSKAPPFKFNEPVRKKRDREALQGIDCKTCKRFYDAVAAGDATGMLASKCEHQDAVSRHRFKYLPPPTPDGFWNIGFDDSVNSPDHAGGTELRTSPRECLISLKIFCTASFVGELKNRHLMDQDQTSQPSVLERPSTIMQAILVGTFNGIMAVTEGSSVGEARLLEVLQFSFTKCCCILQSWLHQVDVEGIDQVSRAAQMSGRRVRLSFKCGLSSCIVPKSGGMDVKFSCSRLDALGGCRRRRPYLERGTRREAGMWPVYWSLRMIDEDNLLRAGIAVDVKSMSEVLTWDILGAGKLGEFEGGKDIGRVFLERAPLSYMKRPRILRQGMRYLRVRIGRAMVSCKCNWMWEALEAGSLPWRFTWAATSELLNAQ